MPVVYHPGFLKRHHATAEHFIDFGGESVDLFPRVDNLNDNR